MTVLNIIELTETTPWVDNLLAVSIVLLIISIIVGVSTAGSIKRKYEKINNICLVIVGISLISTFALGAIADIFTVPNGEYQYEVMIDDTVSFAEVIEKYDIIEQRGEIFVLEEEESND